MTSDDDLRTLRVLFDGQASILRLAEELANCVDVYKNMDEPGLAFRVSMISQSLYDYAEAIRVAYQRRIEREAEEL